MFAVLLISNKKVQKALGSADSSKPEVFKGSNSKISSKKDRPNNKETLLVEKLY